MGTTAGLNRTCRIVLLLLLAVCGSAEAIERARVDFEYVKDRARQLADKPYEPLTADIPDFLRNLDYNTYLAIRSDPSKALWAKEELPFYLTFSLPGYIYNYAVRIHEFTQTHVQEAPFAPHFFDFGKHADLAPRIPASLGYAGFHVFCNQSACKKDEEVAVFLGSNYFRVVGSGTRFGMSTRGLAINTTRDDEEFPLFREFWLGKPRPDSDNLIIYALLDGPSVAGAYRFRITPGPTTEVRVRTCLFFRRTVEQVGIAPFSSMFYFNENSVHKPLDYRPRVHDSDGLLLRTPDGKYVWQPLINPADKLVTTYRFPRPAAFGLCQRQRSFENYQDIDQAYQSRPSSWVEPGAGDWGPGAVVLYTFGADSETIDNVVAFWQPAKSPPAGRPVFFEYSLFYSLHEHLPAGYTVATRTGGPVNPTDLNQYIIDFDGEELRSLEPTDGVEAVTAADRGINLERPILVKNHNNNNWRLILQFRVQDQAMKRGRLTAYLKQQQRRLTETWSYVWTEERQFPQTPQQQAFGTTPTQE